MTKIMIMINKEDNVGKLFYYKFICVYVFLERLVCTNLIDVHALSWVIIQDRLMNHSILQSGEFNPLYSIVHNYDLMSD